MSSSTAKAAAIDVSKYPKDLQATIQKYSDFLSTKLQPSLNETLVQRDQLYNHMSEYFKLKTHLETIRNNDLSQITTRVDLGSDFFVQAQVPSTKYIHVSVGFGFHLQMTLDEADKFIDEKVKCLEKQADRYTLEANNIRAQIKMVYGALSEAMNMEK